VVRLFRTPIFFINKRGFTLIELLVVIAIIGLLSSVVITSLNSARVRARDAQRIADLHQIQLALELYYADKGFYPQSDCGWDCNSYRYSYVTASWAAFAADLAPYMKTVPVDPKNSGCAPWGVSCYSYTYGNVGRTTNSPGYDLTTQLEDGTNPQRCGVRNYKYFFNNSLTWCAAFGGPYNNQIYEASQN
jgi:type II secretion system protein G